MNEVNELDLTSFVMCGLRKIDDKVKLEQSCRSEASDKMKARNPWKSKTHFQKIKYLSF